MPLYLALAVPAIVAAVYVYFGWTRRTRWLATMAAASILVSGLWLRASPQVDEALGGWLIATPETALLLIIVGLAATLTMAGFPAQLANEIKDHVIGPVTARGYGVFATTALPFAVIAATAAVPVISLVAIQIMVVLIAGMVAARRKPAQLRAAYGYGLACTAGLALVALGSLIPAGVTPMILVAAGWAALAGLAPLHWWLPPTVSVASAPVSALIVGVQAPLAWAMLLRLEGPTQRLLIVAAPVSIMVAIVGLIRQRDLRRLVAYVGIAGSGLLAWALATTPEPSSLRMVLSLSLNAVLLYLAVGHVVSLTGSGRIAMVRGQWTRAPLLGGALGLGLLAATVLMPYLAVRPLAALAPTPAGILGLACGIGMILVAIAAAIPTWRMLAGDPADRLDVTTGPARPLGSAGPVLIVATVLALLTPLAAGAISTDLF
ncbi:proton-conducting transporter membrane subunit [Stackebrandtia nassauensis]|uniref:NADH:quinone oxidoreductase/Mrp antiporter transmembrane domain-containing protein n=1 Tax=Stackebrandtia nassauensis (strain DSM 44728 / CIP 108903 / NRRL B-16338 / NBRC 102104 / LLR-40K-21) TaxID=446470 RepID=D3QAM4_STANL|nr:proton-conducting transporter membrane subunit [Stackebrandtia nassauensis]ADD42807.1 hypothetical protein Snas_3136 [Stackebrandtia nassauensis DSM 44728]